MVTEVITVEDSRVRRSLEEIHAVEMTKVTCRTNGGDSTIERV